VAIAAPIAATVGGRATASPQPAPVVDPDYLYGQLYSMATSFSYRISGADGPPQDSSSPFNLSPTVNGWQELYAAWKSELTSTGANGSLASFTTIKDHYFRRSGGYQFDSDDAEATIPGATCPAQRVLVAAHPDERPVPNAVAAEIDNLQTSTSPVFGFGAARRAITDSNLGNEGAYDGLSGVAVTLAEYHALLQWYESNGTYPSRTLKLALLDASRGETSTGLFSREGSAYYAGNLIPDGPQGQIVLFANMDSLGLDYPAYHLGTEFYWNNSNFNGLSGGVPPWFTFIKATPSAPSLTYPDTGPGSPGAEITANSAAITAFHSDLQAAVSAGFAQQGARYAFSVPLENPLRYDHSGDAPGTFSEPYDGSIPTKPAYSPADQAQYSPVRDDADGLEDQKAFFDLGIPGFTVSGVKNSTLDENPYPATTAATIRATPIVSYAGNQTTFQIGNGPPAGMTTTTQATAVGATQVSVAAGSVLTADQPVFIDTGSSIEYNRIAAVSGNTVTLATPLQLAHPSGARFHVNEGQPVGYTGDTIEHLNYFAGGAPHGVDGPGQPTEELERALELPAQWTSLLLSGSHYLGSTAAPTTPVAYFETTPVKPDSTLTVTFDASFARSAGGGTSGLQYYWDFGDGTHAVGATVSHTFSSPIYADVKLAVKDGSSWGVYRQAVAVDGPAGSPPATAPCGTLNQTESNALIAAATIALGG
jgi:hypothetical protein